MLLVGTAWTAAWEGPRRIAFHAGHGVRELRMSDTSFDHDTITAKCIWTRANVRKRYGAASRAHCSSNEQQFIHADHEDRRAVHEGNMSDCDCIVDRCTLLVIATDVRRA